MPLTYLAPEIVELIARDTDEKTLPSFSLVCRTWRWPARRRICSTIKIKAEEVIQLVERLQRHPGYVVSSRSSCSKDPFAIDNNTKEVYVEKEHLLFLLMHLPNLQSLEAFDEFLSPTEGRTGFRLKPQRVGVILSNLKKPKWSFGDRAERGKVGGGLFQDLLSKIVNLESLNIVTSLSTLDFRIQKCPILQYLNVKNCQISVSGIESSTLKIHSFHFHLYKNSRD